MLLMGRSGSGKSRTINKLVGSSLLETRRYSSTTKEVQRVTIPAVQGDVIFDHACAGILPGCAYPATLPEGTMCTQTIDYKIDGPKNKTLNALVERKDNHDKLSDWAVNCKLPTQRFRDQLTRMQSPLHLRNSPRIPLGCS